MAGWLIYSSGDYAREVLWTIEALFGEDVEAHFIDDDPRSEKLAGRDVLPYDEALSRYGTTHRLINAIGNPAARARVTDKTDRDGLRLASIVHPSAVVGPRNVLGEGTIVQANATLTCDIEIGRSCSININSTVGHDVRMGDFVSVSPLTAISGRVDIERCVRIGTGVSIINGTRAKSLRVGEGAVIAAGATVTGDVPPHVLVAGVPAKVKKELAQS